MTRIDSLLQKDFEDVSLLRGKKKTLGSDGIILRDKVSTQHKELILGLKFDEKDSEKLQLNNLRVKLAKKLLKRYKTKPKTAYNREKREKFKKIVTPPAKPENKDNQPENEKKTGWSWALFINWFRQKKYRTVWPSFVAWLGKLSTAVFDFHGWLTGIRLFFLRVNRIFIKANAAPATLGFTVFRGVIAFGGLSYAINLLIDIGTIIYETFIRDRSKKELKLSLGRCLWERFKAVMFEEDPKGNKRIYRMLNDAGWFTINLIGILVTYGAVNFSISIGSVVLSAVMVDAINNVVGFACDVINEIVLGLVKFWNIYSLERKVENAIKLQEEVLEAYENPDVNQKKMTDEEITQLKLENDQLKIIKEKLRNERVKWLDNRLRVVLSLTLVVVGMGLVFFPPAAIPGAVIMGSVLALVFGSLTTGIGAKSFLYAEARINAPAPAAPVSTGDHPVTVPESAPVERPEHTVSNTTDIHNGFAEHPVEPKAEAQKIPVIVENDDPIDKPENGKKPEYQNGRKPAHTNGKSNHHLYPSPLITRSRSISDPLSDTYSMSLFAGQEMRGKESREGSPQRKISIV